MKHYESIETLPVWNFFKIKELGDLRFLLVDEAERAKELTEKVGEELFQLWLAIDSRFTSQFGMTSKFINKLLIEQRISILELSIVEGADKGLVKTKLAGERLALASLESESKPQKLADTVAFVAFEAGFSIDVRTETTEQFFAYIERIRLKYEKLKQSNPEDNG